MHIFEAVFSGVPTTRDGKLVTVTIRHILETSNSDNSSHIIDLLQDNLLHVRRT
jgi:hypothetical protein